jgi:hypothetical protein
MRRILSVVACATLFGAAVPTLASATPPSGTTYGGPASGQLTQVGAQGSNQSPGSQSSGSQSPGSTSATTVTGSLPFTGMNVGFVALIAVALGGSGLVLRMRTRPDRD